MGVSEYNFTTLRIARAYVSLLSRPDGDPRAISLAWIGDCEIRMHISQQPCSIVKHPLFILYFFDHAEQEFIDIRACYDLAEGATAFDAFVSR